MNIHYPPIRINKKGELRKVGFELEYTGLSLPDTARLIASHFNGKMVQNTLNHYTIDDTEWGKFELELDVLWMKKISSEVAKKAESDDPATLESIAETVLSPIVSAIMPYEIITPPFPIGEICRLEKLCNELRLNGAKGTGASPLYAFGMHINPDVPNIELADLKNYLLAFVLLQDWLKIKYHMDLTRQIASFARLFSNDYISHILRPGYNPDFETLVDDYLKFNPTRNRALDMLPMFAYFDKSRVRAVVKDEHVRARPTFHYRMPNCSIDEPGWSVIYDWNLWVAVENLAEDKSKLRELSDAWLKWEDSYIPLKSSWVDQVNQFMESFEFTKINEDIQL